MFLAGCQNLSSCRTLDGQGKLMETYRTETCLKYETPMDINYFICEDEFSICYITETGGISCFPKVEEDSLLGDDELLDGEDTVEIKKSVLL